MRRIPSTGGRAWRAAFLGLALLPATVPGGAEAPCKAILPIDDRGEPISERLEVCRVLGLERHCASFEPTSAKTLSWGDFDSLHAEGEGHGPAAVHRRHFQPADICRWTIPRKAFLRVRGPQAGPVALSVYRQEDPGFRRPLLRLPELGAIEARVPAGALVLSLTRTGLAPDLHLLEARPAGRYAVDFHGRPGWSVLFRVQAEGEPVPGAALEVRPVAGFGTGKPRQTSTGPHGLAVLSGLSVQIAKAAVRSAGFLPKEQAGISASPGSFAFQELPLERAGSVRALVRVEGQPSAEATCEVRRPNPAELAARGRKGPADVLVSATADRQGVCKLPGLPSGSFTLAVRPPPRQGRVEAVWIGAVHVSAGQETLIELDLVPVTVQGMVYLGEEPAHGYRVQAAAAGGRAGQIEDVARATVDESGAYRILLWASGEHFFLVQDPNGSAALFERVLVPEGGEARDFHLAAHGLAGVVIDEAGTPVAGATIGLRWNRTTLTGTADERGAFRFAVRAGGGTAELNAFRSGYRPSETVRLEVPDGAAPPPVQLVLHKGDDLEGSLVSAAGLPVAGAWVGAYQLDPDGMSWQIGAGTTDAAGRFTLPRAGGGPTRIFASGPGCPLRALAVAPGETVGSLRCVEAPAQLAVALRAPEGGALVGEAVVLRRGGLVIPVEVLAAHLARFGLAPFTDGAGRLVIPALEPGTYDLFLASASNAGTLAAGLPHGFLESPSLAPLATTELEITIDPGS